MLRLCFVAGTLGRSARGRPWTVHTEIESTKILAYHTQHCLIRVWIYRAGPNVSGRAARVALFPFC